MADVSVPRIYSCYNCRNHVARHDDIISKNFQVMRATLWSSLIHSSFSDHFSWNFRCLMFTRQFFFCSESVSEKEDESVLIYALDCFTYCNNHFFSDFVFFFVASSTFPNKSYVLEIIFSRLSSTFSPHQKPMFLLYWKFSVLFFDVSPWIGLFLGTFAGLGFFFDASQTFPYKFLESFAKIAAIILDFWAFSKIESHIFLELSRTLFGLFSDLSSTFSRSVILFSVQPWQSFSLFSCYEHNGRTERKSESYDRPSHSCRCLLQRLPESFGLEVWESLRGNPEIQRGQIRTGKV